jgi:hypothetical protein
MVGEKGSSKAASSSQKTANNSVSSKKADAAKGQMSISAFFKKPAQSADAGTPRPPKRTNELDTKAPPAVGNDEPKKNLQPCFEESRSDPEIASVDVVSTTLADTSVKVPNNDDKEDDCVFICEKAPVSKSTKKDPPATSKSVKNNSEESKVSKNRESKTAKLSGMAKQQNTLHFNSNQDTAKSATKPVKTRPPHPEGLNLDCKSDVIMIAEFTSKFRSPLKLERPSICTIIEQN